MINRPDDVRGESGESSVLEPRKRQRVFDSSAPSSSSAIDGTRKTQQQDSHIEDILPTAPSSTFLGEEEEAAPSVTEVSTGDPRHTVKPSARRGVLGRSGGTALFPARRVLRK
jgi:hypothetical protein